MPDAGDHLHERQQETTSAAKHHESTHPHAKHKHITKLRRQITTDTRIQTTNR